MIWGLDNNWLVPPPKIVLKVCKKLQHDRAKGTLVVPVWRSSPYWPILFPDGVRSSFIIGEERFQAHRNVYVHKKLNSPFTHEHMQMVACRIDFYNDFMGNDSEISQDMQSVYIADT